MCPARYPAGGVAGCGVRVLLRTGAALVAVEQAELPAAEVTSRAALLARRQAASSGPARGKKTPVLGPGHSTEEL